MFRGELPGWNQTAPANNHIEVRRYELGLLLHSKPGSFPRTCSLGCTSWTYSLGCASPRTYSLGRTSRRTRSLGCTSPGLHHEGCRPSSPSTEAFPRFSFLRSRDPVRSWAWETSHHPLAAVPRQRLPSHIYHRRSAVRKLPLSRWASPERRRLHAGGRSPGNIRSKGNRWDWDATRRESAPALQWMPRP